MKKLLTTTLLMTSLIMAFINKANAETILASPLVANKHQHYVGSEKLVLNNGKKWKVDHTTTKNINDLKLILKAFRTVKNQSLTIYKKTGDSLQNGLMILIKECRMKGSDHIALHKWLEPLMVKVINLKQASTNAEAAKSISFIDLQLSRYDQFFEFK